jgi:glutamate-1-semialdehyde aminotransferase
MATEDILKRLDEIINQIEILQEATKKAEELRPEEIIWGDIIAGGFFAGAVVNFLRDLTEYISTNYQSPTIAIIAVDALITLVPGIFLYRKFKGKSLS